MRVSRVFDQFEPVVLRQYFITFAFSIAGALINFYFFRQVYFNIGEESFYYYSYSRRIISFISPILILGLAISLPRAIGYAGGNQDQSRQLFFVTTILLSVSSTLWFILNLLLNRWLTALIWGEINDLTLRMNIAVSLYLVSINIAAGIHSYFRGKIKALSAGIIELTVQSILPLIAFLLIDDLISIFYHIGLMIIVFNALLITLILRDYKFRIQSVSSLFKTGIELSVYGIRRIPGDIFYSLMLFLPAYLAGRYFDLELAGIFSFGLSLLTLFNLPATAISFVTLSRSASLLLNGKSKLKSETNALLVTGLAYSLLLLIVLYFFLDKFLMFFFDSEFTRHTDALFKIIYALPFIVIFTILRSLTDSAYKRAYNAFFVFVALTIICCFSIFAVQKANAEILIYGNTAAYFSLAVMSFFMSIKILN